MSGTYNVEIQSNYKKGTTSHAKLEIVQTFDKIQICFIADNSKSCAVNAKIENTHANDDACGDKTGLIAGYAATEVKINDGVFL